jgi:hypothetical protein
MQPAHGPYASNFLNEIHTYFPAFLYSADRFNSVRDIMQYIQSQMSRQANVFNRWQEYHRAQEYQEAELRRNAQRFHQQQTRWTARPRVVVPPSPLFPSQAPQTAPAAVPAVPAGNTTTVLDPWLQALLISLGTQPLALGTQTQRNFWDPVPTGPSAQEIAAASTTYAAPTTLDTRCIVCQDTISEGSQVRKLSHCNHFFHQTCIDTWFQRDPHCPVCRHDIRTRGTGADTNAINTEGL